MSKSIHFDREALCALKEIMEDEFPLLINTFITDSDIRIFTMKHALNNNNFDKLREAAHSFKGTSGNLSAHVLADLCLSLEQKSEEGDFEKMTVLIQSIEQEYTAVKSMIVEML
jgi:HPt (histidine-containing phosphotransfer) domain-containing protein